MFCYLFLGSSLMRDKFRLLVPSPSGIRDKSQYVAAFRCAAFGVLPTIATQGALLLALINIFPEP